MPEGWISGDADLSSEAIWVLPVVERCPGPWYALPSRRFGRSRKDSHAGSSKNGCLPASYTSRRDATRHCSSRDLLHMSARLRYLVASVDVHAFST